MRAMTNRARTPLCSNASQLASAPELALVGSVDAALALLDVALRAANPRVGEARREWEPPAELRDRLAAAILGQATRLRGLLERYEAVVFVSSAPTLLKSVSSAPSRHDAGVQFEVRGPNMSAEHACFLAEALDALSSAIRAEHAGALADLRMRRAERAPWEATGAIDEVDDLPF